MADRADGALSGPARPLSVLVREAAGQLARAGVPSPQVDAAELAAWVLSVPRSRLPAVGPLDEPAAAAYAAAVRRRAERVPLQHITGRAAFRHVEVAVGPGVFVPRPETEVVVGWAVDRARELAAGPRSPVVVDLCAGSGVIALAVADEVPQAEVHAVEVSAAALVWARRNLVGTTVRLHAADAADALPELDAVVDVVVANPPYIPDDGLVRDPEVLAHDPPLALWGHGPDGLDVMRQVTESARRLLRPGGWLVVEHADVQGPAVGELLRRQGGWVDVADHPDLAGRSRFATARRSPAGHGPGAERAGRA
jgi:release factor glutamine methyltransferase